MVTSKRLRTSFDTLWRIRQAEQDTIFGTMKDAVIVGTHVITADASTQRLVILNGDNGTVQSIVGRKGGGPNEFRQIQGLLSWRDSIVIVRDAQNARITAWDLEPFELDSTLLSGSVVPALTGVCSFEKGGVLTAGVGSSAVALLDASTNITFQAHKVWPEHQNAGVERAQLVAGDGSTCYAISAFGPGIVAYGSTGEIRRAMLREHFGRPKETSVPGGTRVSAGTQSAGGACVLGNALLILRDHLDGKPQLVDVYRTDDLSYRGSFDWPEHVLGLHCTRDRRLLLRSYRDGLFALTLLRVTID